MQNSMNTSEMHFLRDNFVNERIKHSLGKKSSNPAKSSSYKYFSPMIPFKKIFLFKRRDYGNECLDFSVSEIYVVSTYSYT